MYDTARPIPLGLDDHLASIVSCEETHQSLGHLVKPLHNCLSDLDNKKTWQHDWMAVKAVKSLASHLYFAGRNPARHRLDPLHPLWPCPPLTIQFTRLQKISIIHSVCPTMFYGWSNENLWWRTCQRGIPQPSTPWRCRVGGCRLSCCILQP